MSSKSQLKFHAVEERRSQLKAAKTAEADTQRRSDKDKYLELVSRVNAASDREMQRVLLAR
jgi:hypothetical protein